MKKGYDIFVISLVVASLLAIASANVYSIYFCVDGQSNTSCVCGHTPSSIIGYGQVIIGGLNYSCDNTAEDNICPEDYQDAYTGLVGNCSNCPDIDCIVRNLSNEGYVWGYVRDTNGNPIERASVVGSPSKWNESANLERNTSTQFVAGSVLYNYSGFITGRYSFKVSKSGYDTAIIPVTVTRGGIIRADFVLQNGTCHSDCSNSYGRCNAACDGLTFDGGASSCNFGSTSGVSAQETKDTCNNIDAGKTSWIKTYNSTHSWYVDCCEGIPYTKYNAKVETDTNEKIKNLIKYEKIVRYGYEPSRLVIAYWR
jgi:hypothetical protein